MVIDSENGVDTPVGWSMSRRRNVRAAMDDLKKREKTRDDYIGLYSVAGERRSRDEGAFSAIEDWAGARALDGVAWTDLASNFGQETGERYSVDAAIRYLETLRGHDRVQALRYIQNAPAFVRTPLRTAFLATLEGVPE